MSNKGISIDQATKMLRKTNSVFVELFKHGSLVVEFYKPDQIDKQEPHQRDEIYVIASGRGIFFNGSEKLKFNPGDFFFVPAGVSHRFEKFTEDFATWVFFFGPVGGER